MIVGVDPPPTLAQPGAFEVASDDSARCRSTPGRCSGLQLAAATALDTSAAGAAALQNGINGTTNLLLQLPDGVRNLVVADGGDAPQTLLPADPGRDRGSGRAKLGPSRRSSTPAAARTPRWPGCRRRRAGPGRRRSTPARRTPAASRPSSSAGGGRGWRALAVGRPARGSATGRMRRESPAGRRAGHGPASLRTVRPRRPPRRAAGSADVPAAVDGSGDRAGVDALPPARPVAARCGAGGVGGDGRRARAGACSPWPWLLGALVLLALVAGGLLLARRRRGRPPDGASRPVADPEPAGRADHPPWTLPRHVRRHAAPTPSGVREDDDH